jgi:hypothetical protein
MDSPKDTETPTEKGKRVHHFIWYLTKDTKDTESSPSPARGTNELFVPARTDVITKGCGACDMPEACGTRKDS